MKTSSDSAVAIRTASANHVERGEDVGVILDALRSIVRELRLASREAEQRVGVHGAQLHALRQLSDSPTMSLTELADRTHTDISSVSVVVSRLVEQGWSPGSRPMTTVGVWRWRLPLAAVRCCVARRRPAARDCCAPPPT